MAYEQDCGIGAEDARIDADELRAQFDLYLGTSGSEQRDQTRLNNILDQLHKHGIASGPDKENQVHIRPIIVHLSDPEQLTLLLQHFKQLAKDHPAEGDTPTAQETTSTHD
jgi:ribosomal protein S15P/S13E